MPIREGIVPPMNGGACHRQRTPRSARKRELCRLVLARSDVNAARHACNLLLKNVGALSDDLYEPLYYAVAISYARPFSANRPLGSLAPRWRRFADSRLQDAHTRLLEARNKSIAHSDHRRVQIAPPGCPAQVGPVRAQFARTGVFVEHTYYKLDWFKDVRDTCVDLGHRLHQECEALLRELYDGRQLPAAPFLLTFNDDL
jgi:hypothetical protein